MDAHGTDHDDPVPVGAERFVGRAAELASLREAMLLALRGQGRMAVLSGEPGIGKTHIAQQLADEAAAAGLRVLWGRCPEEPGAPPYWPWRQAMRRCIADWNRCTLRTVAGHGAGDLAVFEPEIAARLELPAVAAPAHDSAEAAAAARFRLFDAVGGFWQRAAATAPLLLILDDLHGADVPSLKLLEHLAAELRSLPLMIVGTCRAAEVDRSHPLADALTQAARHAPLLRLKLGRFSADETAQFVAGVDQRWTPQLAALLHQRSDGHPLFLAEMTRHLQEAQRGSTPTEAEVQALLHLPPGVREFIASRLSRLSPTCVQVLTRAAVIGRRFGIELLAMLLDDGAAQAHGALQEACRAGLIEALAEPGAYQFSHTLGRDALYEELPAAERARLHLRIAETLEERHAHDPALLTTLAYHYHEARSAGAAAKAAEYARRAGEQAMATRAYEDAAVHYQRALQSHGPARDAVACELLLSLGAAQVRAGEAEAGRNAFVEAASLARALCLPQAMARAALGYVDISWLEAQLSAVAASLAKEALLMNSPLDSAQRALLLAALTRSLLLMGHSDAAVAMHDNATACARRVGDAHALFVALSSIAPAQWEPALLPRRLAAVREAMQLAPRCGDWLTTVGLGWHVGTLVEAGDIAAADQAVALFVGELPLRWHPHLGGDCRAMVALHRGRFDEAERLIREQMQRARRYGYPQAFDAASVQMFGLKREQGRLAELAPALDLFRRHAPPGGTWLPGYALLCCELGRRDDARTAFEQIAADGLQPDHKADYMHRNLAYLCMVCTSLGDAARAERLYALLAPFAGRNYVFGGNVECFGATDRLLGMLAATMQRWDLAAPHFESALALDAAGAALPWLVHTQHEYAAMLLVRRHDGDAPRAARLLDAALQGSRGLGMRALERRVLDLQGAASPSSPSGSAGGLSPRELQVLRLVAEGKTNQEIADTLFRSANTVANHVRSILAKVGCANRTEAAAFAARHGLLDRP